MEFSSNYSYLLDVTDSDAKRNSGWFSFRYSNMRFDCVIFIDPFGRTGVPFFIEIGSKKIRSSFNKGVNRSYKEKLFDL